MFDAALAGFSLGLSLIVAIGAQNAFVLRQGLRRAFVLEVALACAISDALLIAAGVAGFATLADVMPRLLPIFRWGGAAFLIVYGARSFWAAWKGGEALEAKGNGGGGSGSRMAVLATCLALTWLNPHVYLDTVALVGSISTRYAPQELAFGIGAVIASFTFFFALAYGARLLAPLFARPGAWRVLDVVIGVVMWAIAAGLILG
ncbi:MAG: amino acid transporter [Vannielia sp.]|uniref:LysE/ArgO family amino acid transporter n=1 Tax=Rhodobacterales TaxID=204455 RepID=UPI002096422E|nr:LysE/ArgO family amino acid transporter [Oceanicola sp. 502str15]MCO6381350.1 LysE family transporter [Oceanicola sp. 502str15]